MEIINKILTMRPTHPIVNILRDYSKEYLWGDDIDNVFYCTDVMFFFAK